MAVTKKSLISSTSAPKSSTKTAKAPVAPVAGEKLVSAMRMAKTAPIVSAKKLGKASPVINAKKLGKASPVINAKKLGKASFV